MISAVEVKNLRGIREGKLEGLTPLVVLVGPNGCGKSTLLDALLIGGSNSPADAIDEVVSRHNTMGDAARWLFWKGDRNSTLEIAVKDAIDIRGYRLRVAGDWFRGSLYFSCEFLVNSESLGVITARINSSPIGDGHDYLQLQTLESRLIETDSRKVRLTELYSRAVEGGRKKDIVALLKQVIFGFENLEILTEGGSPYLSIVLNDHSIPNEITGEGIQALLRLSLELASRPGGIVLLEEPEVHQHPGALRQSAKAIWAAIRRGVQVVISTHSLEFIDTLLSEVQTQEELDQMSVFRLLLKEGCLSSSRIAGSDIAFSRTEIGDDLR